MLSIIAKTPTMWYSESDLKTWVCIVKLTTQICLSIDFDLSLQTISAAHRLHWEKQVQWKGVNLPQEWEMLHIRNFGSSGSLENFFLLLWAWYGTCHLEVYFLVYSCFITNYFYLDMRTRNLTFLVCVMKTPLVKAPRPVL